MKSFTAHRAARTALQRIACPAPACRASPQLTTAARATRAAATRLSSTFSAITAAARQQRPVANAVCRASTGASVRHLHASPATLRDATLYNYDEIKQLSEAPSEERVLIDVREPSEYEAGFIPSALNIPVSSQPDAMLLDAVDFETRFGFPKPDLDKEVIFYCKAGVRSRAAAKLAEQGGFKIIGEYPGSWMDWVKHGGRSEKP